MTASASELEEEIAHLRDLDLSRPIICLAICSTA
jgi:hypothetical protein